MIKMFEPHIEDECINTIKLSLKSGNFTNGPVSKEFERKFADYIGCKYAISVNSGTSALHLALLSNGIGPGDEVITSSLSFIATKNAIKMTGATPIFVDVKDDFNINECLIEDKINPKTKAILPVNLFGKPVEYKRIENICNENELKLISDSCQSLGAEYQNKKIGSVETNAFSFYPTKAINTMEGGMITTNSMNVYNKCQILKNHGDGGFNGFGFNYRMNEVSAIMGLYQLPFLDQMNNKRIEIANKFNKINKLIKPNLLPIEKDIKHVYHQYTLTAPSYFHLTRDEIMKKLKDNGIESRIYYEKPLSKRIDKTEMAFKLANTSFSIPIHPNLKSEEINKIINVLNDV